MTRRAHRRLFWGVVAVLLAAHALAPSRPGLFLGIAALPFDLGYHLAWTAAAALAVVHLCTRVWEAPP